MFKISLHVAVKMGNIEQVLWMIHPVFVMKLYVGKQNLSRTTKLNQRTKKQKQFLQILMK